MEKKFMIWLFDNQLVDMDSMIDKYINHGKLDTKSYKKITNTICDAVIEDYNNSKIEQKVNKMGRKKVLTENEVFKILKNFTTECVHGGDFDQGNSEEDTLSILKNWWNKEKNKYLKI